LDRHTALIREWHGVSHRVTVLADGVLLRGARYRSLAEVARKITGTRWSGPRFFRLRAPITLFRSTRRMRGERRRKAVYSAGETEIDKPHDLRGGRARSRAVRRGELPHRQRDRRVAMLAAPFGAPCLLAMTAY
jgi:hypothetical protein